MGRERTIARVVEQSDPLESRRKRPASEIRFAGTASTADVGRTTGELMESTRQDLWEAVELALGASGGDRPSTEADPKSSVLYRVWTSPPINAEADRLPDDACVVLENWLQLVEPADVFAFLEAVYDSLDPGARTRFAAAVNASLERGRSDHRLVARRLLPVTSKSDISTLERALVTSRATQWGEVEARLLDAIERLARKPDPDTRGAAEHALGAIKAACTAVTGERHRDVGLALTQLEARGYLDKVLTSAYKGLFPYVENNSRALATDDARIILVICAGLICHLTSVKLG